MAEKTGNANDQENTVFAEAMRRYRASYEYQRDHWHERWEEDSDLYDQERTKVEYQGVTDSSSPLPYSTVETLVAALNNADIRADFISTDPTRNPDNAPLNALIDEWADLDGWQANAEESYREVFKIGIDGNMLTMEDGRAHEITFSARDAIIDPSIVHPAQLQKRGHYAGRRYLVPKGSMDDEKVVDIDPESKTYGELIKRYNFKGRYANRPTDEPTDAERVEMFYGSPLSEADKSQDEIIELWDVDKIVTIKNRSQWAEEVNPHKARHERLLRTKYLGQINAQGLSLEDLAAATEKAEKRAKDEARGIVPFYFYRNVRRKSQFYATGEIRPIVREIKRLINMTNMEGDFLLKQVAGQRELDPEYEDWLDLIDDDPATVYPFKPGSLKYIDSPILPSNSFAGRQEIKGTVRETTAVSEVANGTISDKDRTKFEVRSALGQTSARIESRAKVWIADTLYWKYWILLHLIQLYVTEPVLVYAPDALVDADEIGEKYGVVLPEDTAIFDPADFADVEFRPRITLEVDAESKQAESRKEARESFAMLIQDATNNLAEIKKTLYPKMFNLGKDELRRITTPPPAPDPVVDPVTGLPVPTDPALAPTAAPVAPQAPMPGVPGA